MTSIDGGEIDAWLSQVKSRLQNFTRDSLFDASITPDRAWWAQTFEACDQTHKKLTEITRNLGHSDGTCWQLANRSPTRVSYRGRRIYAYQLAYWLEMLFSPHLAKWSGTSAITGAVLILSTSFTAHSATI